MAIPGMKSNLTSGWTKKKTVIATIAMTPGTTRSLILAEFTNKPFKDGDKNALSDGVSLAGHALCVNRPNCFPCNGNHPVENYAMPLAEETGFE